SKLQAGSLTTIALTTRLAATTNTNNRSFVSASITRPAEQTGAHNHVQKTESSRVCENVRCRCGGHLDPVHRALVCRDCRVERSDPDGRGRIWWARSRGACQVHQQGQRLSPNGLVRCRPKGVGGG